MKIGTVNLSSVDQVTEFTKSLVFGKFEGGADPRMRSCLEPRFYATGISQSRPADQTRLTEATAVFLAVATRVVQTTAQ
jgi:hypothetical protein